MTIVFSLTLACALLWATRVLVGQYVAWRNADREDAERLARRQERAIASLGRVDWPRRWGG